MTPRLVAHLAAPSPSPAAGAVAEEAPSAMVLESVVAPVFSVPSGLKATMPLSIRPWGRLGSVCTSDGGSARTSAYHWLGVADFSKSTTTVREPPFESDTGTVTEKSGFTPVALLLAYSVMLTSVAGEVAGLTSALYPGAEAVPAPALVAGAVTGWSALRLAATVPSVVGWALLATCRMLIGERLPRFAESTEMDPLTSAGQPSR